LHDIKDQNQNHAQPQISVAKQPSEISATVPIESSAVDNGLREELDDIRDRLRAAELVSAGMATLSARNDALEDRLQKILCKSELDIQRPLLPSPKSELSGHEQVLRHLPEMQDIDSTPPQEGNSRDHVPRDAAEWTALLPSHLHSHFHKFLSSWSSAHPNIYAGSPLTRSPERSALKSDTRSTEGLNDVILSPSAQLQNMIELWEMGYHHPATNREALRRSNNSLEGALKLLSAGQRHSPKRNHKSSPKDFSFSPKERPFKLDGHDFIEAEILNPPSPHRGSPKQNLQKSFTFSPTSP